MIPSTEITQPIIVLVSILKSKRKSGNARTIIVTPTSQIQLIIMIVFGSL
jgi:hypothetical protein